MSVLQQAERYCDLGLAVVPVPFQSKACLLQDWATTRLSKADLPQHFNGAPQNIAAVCGTLSGGVVILDCDWPEAANIARHVFDTVAYGRDKAPYSHFIFRCPELTQTVKHTVTGPNKPADRRKAVVEVLSDGHQCLLPGSTQPEGDKVRFSRRPSSTPIAAIDSGTLTTWAGRIAGAAILLYHWPDFEGSRHDLTLALTGACLHSGWVAEDIGKLFGAFFKAGDDEARDRKKAVLDTVKAFQGGANVTGWPTAAELLGDLAPLIADKWQLNLNPLGALIIGGKSQAAVPVVTGWPELLPFEQPDIGHRDYPVSALGSLQIVVDTVAHLQQAPVGLVAQCVLAAVATAIQGQFDIEVPHGRYPLSLYLLTLGETGERKSSTDGLVFKPHDEWARDTLSQMAPADDDAVPAFQPYLFFEGGTVEGLRKQLGSHWPSVICNNSDAADFIGGHSMREGRETATAAFLCKLWEGQLRGYMRGQDNKPITLYGRRVSLSWMVQPQHVEGLVNGGMASQGLLSRLLVSYPQSLIGQRKYLIPDESRLAVLEGYNEQIKTLLETPMDMDPVSGRLSPIPLYLDGPAKGLYAQLNDHYEATLAGSGINAGIRDYANKSGQHLARLAGVLCAFEGVPAITTHHLERAKILLDYYMAEWRDLQTRIGALDPETQKPAALLEWLRAYIAKQPGPFKLKTLCQYGPRACGRSSDEMKVHISVLIRRGYARPVQNNSYELRPENVD
jgi:uncharacterized protein DUF3987/bifunctional DNA primase/polymerase-like protein